MNTERNYDAEIADTADHQYAYGFDFDVMHPYMLRSFEPFMNRAGSVLELGSFKGDFTRRLTGYFNDITCVEASDVALTEAKRKLGDKIEFIHSRFETAKLPRRYDNIVLTHVLEHLDDPVALLKRINDEWLADGGRFFLVCPNANAPSRQIAVKMGLITHNAAVTPAEDQHGHRCTYSLDTLERDAWPPDCVSCIAAASSSRRSRTSSGTACWRPTLSRRSTSRAAISSGRSIPIFAPASS